MQKPMRKIGIVAGAVLGLACGGLETPEPPADATPAVESVPTATPGLLAAAPEPPSTEADKPTTPAAPTPASAPVPTPEPVEASTLTGSIARVQGKTVDLQLDAGARPATGAQGTLFKRVEQNFAGMSMTAWVDIGLVEVTQSSGASAAGTIQVRILERHSEVVVNGDTRNHFVPESTIRLEW